jgi:alpha-1,3-rhamnosyl/mannosyltransferase
VAITVHDNSVRRYPGGHPLEWRAYCAAVLPGRARRASVVITPSEFVREELLDAWGLDPSRVVAIPLGVSREFAPGRRPPRSGRPRLLFAGAPMERKNLPSVLRAMAAAAPGSALADAELVVSGASGESFPDMVRAAAGAGVGKRLRWLGPLADDAMPDLYRSADALVYPSLDEGFGLPPLEAMACATPVVAAARGSLPETLGDAALLVDPTRTDELGNALERVLRDSELRGRLTEAGIGRSARYTWERCAAATCRAYQRALA